MPPTRQLAVSILALLALAGCHRAPAPQPAPAVFVLETALQHWYGRYDPATQTARANLPEHPAIDLANTDFAPNDPVDITAIFDAAYTQAGHPRHVIVTAAVPHRSDKPGRPGDDRFHCLACRPVIGMAVFTLRNNAWLLESEDLAADVTGSNGRAPDVRLVSLGTDVHGVRLESHTEALDYASAHLSLLVPWRETVLRAFTAESANSNRSACGPDSPLQEPCYAWQKAEAFVPVPGQQYDDLTLTASGTKPPPEAEVAPTPTAKTARPHGKPLPPPPAPQAMLYTTVERLRFRDGKYVPLESDQAAQR